MAKAKTGFDAEDAERHARTKNIRQEVLARSDKFSDLASLAPHGFEDEAEARLLEARQFLRSGQVESLSPLLPLLLQLKGRPYKLDDHFPFEPYFNPFMPKSFLYKTGRQVAKSTSLAAQGIVSSISVPYLSTLYVTPLFEMIRRFSHNYVRQFIETSPIKKMMVSSKVSNQILQRGFLNGSSMYFSYAFLDAERTRGIPADRNCIDEVQDLNYDFLQIIHETLSGSPWGIRMYSGTPKSLDNTIEKLWLDSSQAEWVTPCLNPGCGHWSIPKPDYDLYAMIGKWHSDISEKCPGTLCGKCQKPINPRDGHWLHAVEEKRHDFPGHHVPQFIMPMHYADPEKWDILTGKQSGRENTTPTTFLNEVCGESSDVGAKLVTVTDLKAAAVLPWENKIEQSSKQINRYFRRILAVDWGGGGGTISKGSAAKKGGEQKRMRTSFTSLAVLGMTPEGRIDVLWGFRSLRTHDWEYEAQLCLEAVQRLKCTHIVHDYSNAGEGRLVLLYQSGFPLTNIINIRYHGVGHNIMNYHPPTDDCPHPIYSVDKSRSLVTTCGCIKHGLIRFFQYDYKGTHDTGLMHDFLALLEEKVESRLGTDVYTIVRNPNLSDDWAQAINIGCCALWWMTKKWPNIAEAAKVQIKPSMIKHVHPVAQIDWQDM